MTYVAWTISETPVCQCGVPERRTCVDVFQPSSVNQSGLRWPCSRITRRASAKRARQAGSSGELLVYGCIPKMSNESPAPAA